MVQRHNTPQTPLKQTSTLHKVLLLVVGFFLPGILLAWAGSTSVKTSSSAAKKTASPAPYTGPVTAIINAHIHPMTTASFKGTILLQSGRVKALGKTLTPPQGAKIIDAKGKPVTPGIALSNTSLGLVEISLEKSTRNAAMKTHAPIRAAFRAIDGFEPSSTTIPIARIEGITTAILRPRGGIISGQSAFVRLWGLGEASHIKTPLAVHASLRDGHVAHTWLRLRQLFSDTRMWMKGANTSTNGHHRTLGAGVLDLKVMAKVVKRELPFVLEVHRAIDILNAIKFAKQQKIKLVISGASEAWRVAKQLAKHNIPVLLGPLRNLPRSFSRLGSRYDNAALLHKAGVLFALGAGGGAHHIRHIRQYAGQAVSYGLPHKAAMKAITHNLFRIYGLHQQAGALTPGMEANVVLWSGDPLELSTIAKQVWISGNMIPMRSRQTLLRDRYLKRLKLKK